MSKEQEEHIEDVSRANPSEEPPGPSRYLAKEFREMLLTPIRQNKEPNCFLITALNVIKRNKAFAYMAHSGIEVLSDGWLVRVPLLGEPSKKLRIFHSDIEGREHRGTETHALEGEELYKILEATYYKIKYPDLPIPQAKAKKQGGQSGHVLYALFGDSAQYQLLKKADAKDDEASSQLKQNVFQKLDHFSSESDMLVFHPHSKGEKVTGDVVQDEELYAVPGTPYHLAKSHSYAVIDVDPDQKTVTMLNPWNKRVVQSPASGNEYDHVGQLITLTYEQFYNAARSFTFAQSNVPELKKAVAKRQAFMEQGELTIKNPVIRALSGCRITRYSNEDLPSMSRKRPGIMYSFDSKQFKFSASPSIGIHGEHYITLSRENSEGYYIIHDLDKIASARIIRSLKGNAEDIREGLKYIVENAIDLS